MATLTYDQVRPDLTSGTIVLFAGRGIFSGAIRAATGSRWTHVGIVARLRDYGAVSLLESDKLPTNRGDGAGVRMVELSARVRDYGPRNVAFRVAEYENPLEEERVLQSLMSSRRQFEGRPYETKRLQLFLAAYDGPFGAAEREDLASLFCSEYAIKILRLAELHRSVDSAGEWTPADFAGRIFDQAVARDRVRYSQLRTLLADN